MGILNSIKEKLLGKAAAPATITPKVQAGASAAALAEAAGKAALAKAAAKAPVDVEAILEAAVKAKGIKLNWRTSIVDLLKALDLDSSLTARKELAAELKYTGTDADGSAEKNIWLHKTLMKTLAENGGKIPNELLS
jgi:nucleoid-associated protein YgaU